jgi:hypothetical protein
VNYDLIFGERQEPKIYQIGNVHFFNCDKLVARKILHSGEIYC